ncbi:MAG: phosphatidate cytidylyltransferase [Planctomycetota bacterium]|nr:phosphatidate cytidylyltransferase [Planctomycetota bacterium]
MKGLANRLRWGIPILIISVGLLCADLYGWLDGYGLWILSLIFGAGALFEAISFLPNPGRNLRAFQLAWIFAYGVAVSGLVFVCTPTAGLPSNFLNETSTTLLGAVLLLSTLVSTALGRASNPASNPAKGRFWVRAYPLFAMFWLAIPISCTLLLASLGSGDTSVGIHLVLCSVLMVKGSDTGAYFVGRNFGQRRLHPVSPKKTVEGLLAGIVSAAAIGFIYAQQLADPSLTPELALFIGVLVAVVGQISDLQESVLKRRAGRKDSGATIPGLGGALDMLDSLILVMPMVLWLRIVLGD